MDRLNLQSKTTALPGTIESYWFENTTIGLQRAQYLRLMIPLQTFDSGLDYEEDPVDTVLLFDWYRVNLAGPDGLDGLDLNHRAYPKAEASVYIGAAHNWCQVNKLEVTLLQGNTCRVQGELLIEFEHQGVAENESFVFTTTAMYTPA